LYNKQEHMGGERNLAAFLFLAMAIHGLENKITAEFRERAGKDAGATKQRQDAAG
jgi:hypothetical protein